MPIHRLSFQGIDLVDRTLMVVDPNHFRFKQGTLIRITHDDGSEAPKFSRIDGKGKPEWVSLDRLTIFDPEDPDHIAMRAKARLKGVD